LQTATPAVPVVIASSDPYLIGPGVKDKQAKPAHYGPQRRWGSDEFLRKQRRRREAEPMPSEFATAHRQVVKPGQGFVLALSESVALQELRARLLETAY
jgi:hypothetical protein